jgi:hypothetical protein
VFRGRIKNDRFAEMLLYSEYLSETKGAIFDWPFGLVVTMMGFREYLTKSQIRYWEFDEARISS